ncbi:MAG: MFS transporter, partial [Desulfobacteraceae bacterium]
LRFAVWGIGRFMYRTRHQGLSQVPATGPCILVSNHVSLVDWLLITGACRRPIRFVIYEPIYRLPVLNLIFKSAKAIPIHSRQKNPHVYHQAFKQMQKVLENGEVLCIFPEGKLTCDGEIDVFKKGIEKLMKTHPVPVVPMAIRGMWGSFFSHRNGRALRSMPRRFWSRVELIIGAPMVPECFDITRLRQEVMGLRQGCQ